MLELVIETAAPATDAGRFAASAIVDVADWSLSLEVDRPYCSVDTCP